MATQTGVDEGHGTTSDDGPRHESVEEAVFKYVGVEFRADNEKTKKGAGSDSEGESSSRPDDTVAIPSAAAGKNSGGANNGGNRNNMTDMEWFFRHEELSGHDTAEGTDDAGNGEPQQQQALAMAAVAAAFASKGSSKRNRGEAANNDDDDEEEEEGQQESNQSKHEKKQKRKKKKSKKDHDSKKSQKERKQKLQLAVDPELATLDEPAVSDNEASHPDFQQYLHTGDEEVDENEDSRHNKETASKRIGTADGGSNADQGGHERGVKQYSELQKTSNNLEKPVQSAKKEYPDVLPKVVSSSEFSVLPNVTHLIQSAALKASEIIGTTTQSNGKSFDASEEAALEQFVSEYQAIKNLTRRQICERIWSNERRKDDFWINICKVLPYRTRSSIYKHVRRKYHIFEQRGKWTPQEEHELAVLCVEKEGQWSEIGKALGRMPEDCRDRWRNYVKCGSNRASNKWSEAEEDQLKKVITEMLEESQRASEDPEDKIDSGDKDGMEKKRQPKAFKDIINWTIVSERMGGTRSRIQCRYKWNKLIKKEAMAKIQTITEEDKKWILEKLRDLGFTEDSQIDWEELALLKPGAKLSGTELKICYEKMRSNVKSYKQKTVNAITKELLGVPEESGEASENKD